MLGSQSVKDIKREKNLQNKLSLWRLVCIIIQYSKSDNGKIPKCSSFKFALRGIWCVCVRVRVRVGVCVCVVCVYLTCLFLFFLVFVLQNLQKLIQQNKNSKVLLYKLYFNFAWFILVHLGDKLCSAAFLARLISPLLS